MNKLFEKGMIVEMEVITEAQIRTAVGRLPHRFRSHSDLASHLHRVGVHGGYRTADRVLQKLRKAGLAHFSKGWWTVDQTAVTAAIGDQP